MNNPFYFVLALMAMIFTFVLIKHRMQLNARGQGSPGEHAENLRLREEVKQLKERLHVLERIAVDFAYPQPEPAFARAGPAPGRG